MTRIIGPSGGYCKTFSFGFACLIYHATTAFCRKNYDYRNDSLGKTTGQMIGAARSARQNLVEGSSRAGTSRETELRRNTKIRRVTEQEDSLDPPQPPERDLFYEPHYRTTRSGHLV